MRVFRVLATLSIMVALFLGGALSVYAAPILHESFTTAGDANSVAIYGNNFVAQQFTSEATSHSVTSIKVELLKVGTPNAVTVSLYNAAAGVPTTKIASVTYSGSSISTSYAMYEFLISPAQTLLPSTQYAVVVSCTSGDNANYIQWHQVNAGGLANGIGSDSANGGVSWTVDAGGADYLFEIYGEVVFQVKGANVFEDYLVDGDWLIVAECINTYPGYYPNTDVTRYFNVQLLDPTGTIVLAATTLKSWGDAPVSIYLSPASVIPLTVGQAYIIRMIGTFTGTPSTSYTLQNSATKMDWVGNDLRYLDQWSLLTSNSMHDYVYGVGNTQNPYTLSDPKGNMVLSTSIGDKFVSGISSIMVVRPNLFESVVTRPDYTIQPATNTYDNLYTWQNQVGTTIASDATTFGAVLGVTAKDILSMAIWLIYGFAMLFIFAANQASETVFAAVLCVPVLFIGLHFRLIEGYIIAMMALFALLLWLMKTWFNK